MKTDRNFTGNLLLQLINSLVIYIIMSLTAIADQSFESRENIKEGSLIGKINSTAPSNLSIINNLDSDKDGKDAFRLEGSNLIVNDAGDLDYEAVIKRSTTVPAISAGVFHSLALKDNGEIVAWGDNEFGQLNVPDGLANVIAIDAGVFHNLALKADGQVVAWGINDLGQCDVPRGLNKVIAIAAGGGHSVALKEDGTVVAWGDNFLGQTDIPDGLNDVIDIAAGDDHALALKENGTVIGWGSREFGQSVISPTVRKKIELGGGAIQIGGGATHSLSLNKDGTVTNWGITIASDNLFPPEEIKSSGNVISIDTGNRHNLALMKNGTVAAWGRNSLGQSNVPKGLNHVNSVAAGFQHSLALKKDGSIVAWGNNEYGQLNAPASVRTGPVNMITIVIRQKNGLIITDSKIRITVTDDREEDADNDGLTQAQEEDEYGTSDTNYDTDGDGYNDKEEIDSGTDPTDPQSIPAEQIRILDFTVNGLPGPLQSLTITFTSKNNTNYKIERSKDLISWETIIDNVKGSGGAIQVTDTDPVINSYQSFYRVKKD